MGLHPDLLPALGRLIGAAAQNSQGFVVCHAKRLIAALEYEACRSLPLSKEFGATDVQDIERPAWHWMGR